MGVIRHGRHQASFGLCPRYWTKLTTACQFWSIGESPGSFHKDKNPGGYNRKPAAEAHNRESSCTIFTPSVTAHCVGCL